MTDWDGPAQTLDLLGSIRALDAVKAADRGARDHAVKIGTRHSILHTAVTARLLRRRHSVHITHRKRLTAAHFWQRMPHSHSKTSIVCRIVTNVTNGD